jgi:sporulation-control protein spo0M
LSIRKLLASAGFGMARLELRLHQTEHPRGNEITGVVEVTGGMAPQEIRSPT